MGDQIELREGEIAERVVSVTPDRCTKIGVGSQELSILSTPALIEIMEYTCKDILDKYLMPNQGSVGISWINARHLAATPVGKELRAIATLTKVEGRKCLFEVVAEDSFEKVGDGTHQRFIIDLDKFRDRISRKLAEVNQKS